MGYGPFGKKKPSPQSPQTPFELMPNNPLLQPVRQDNGTIFNPQNGKVIDPLTGMTLVDPGAANYKSVPHNPLAWAQKHFGAQNFGGLQRGAGNGGQTGGNPPAAPMGNSNTSGMGVQGSPASAAAGPAVAMPAQPAPQLVGQPRDLTLNDFLNLAALERAQLQTDTKAALQSAQRWGPIKKLALGAIAAASPYNANVAYHGMKNVTNGINAANQAYTSSYDSSVPLEAAKILAGQNAGSAYPQWRQDANDIKRRELELRDKRNRDQKAIADDLIRQRGIELTQKISESAAKSFQAMQALSRMDRALAVQEQNARTEAERVRVTKARDEVNKKMGIITAGNDARMKTFEILKQLGETDQYGEFKNRPLHNLYPEFSKYLRGEGSLDEATKDDNTFLDNIMNGLANLMSPAGQTQAQPQAQPQGQAPQAQPQAQPPAGAPRYTKKEILDELERRRAAGLMK